MISSTGINPSVTRYSLTFNQVYAKLPSMMGNRLRRILKREGVSAYRLHKDLEIDQGQLSRFFAGKQSISLKMLERIADYLGYELDLVKRKRSRKGG